MTYDGTLCTGEVFTVDQDTGVCSRWDGSTGFPCGVTLHNNKLVDASGDPVALGGAPADGQRLNYVEFGIVGIKSSCATDDINKGQPYKGAANGRVVNLSVTEASSQDKQVCRLLDFQDKNSASGALAWFFWTGYMTNTNKTS
jgi:hypothetical protein